MNLLFEHTTAFQGNPHFYSGERDFNRVVTVGVPSRIAQPWRLLGGRFQMGWGNALNGKCLVQEKSMRRMGGSLSDFRKRKGILDSISTFSHIVRNRVVTLSALRSNAQPWRLFLCTASNMGGEVW